MPYGPEPDYEHHPFSTLRGFLPHEEEYHLLLTHYQPVSQSLGLFLVALQSKSSHLSSIYTIDYDRQRAHFMSGKHVMLNISSPVQ